MKNDQKAKLKAILKEEIDLIGADVIEKEYIEKVKKYSELFQVQPFGAEIRFPYNLLIPLLNKDTNGLFFGYLMLNLLNVGVTQFYLNKEELEILFKNYDDTKSLEITEEMYLNFIGYIRETKIIQIVGFRNNTFKFEIVDPAFLGVFKAKKLYDYFINKNDDSN